MRKHLIHGPHRASRHQWVRCRHRLSQALVEDERVSCRPRDNASWEPALKKTGCSQFGLRGRNECRWFRGLIQITFHVAYTAPPPHPFAKNAADVKIRSE